MKTITTQIESLQEEINNTSNVYKLKSLKNKLGWLKAEQKGNFITKSDLTEYKSLIIFMVKKSLYFNTYENIVQVMNILLEKVESKQLVFKTKRGIKGILTNEVKMISKSVSWDVLVKNYPEVLQSTLQGLEKSRPFEQFYINLFM